MTTTLDQRTSSHDANGRFAKGNPGGPGNPNARRIAAIRAAVVAAVTDEDLVAIMRKLIELAVEGDREAAKLVLHYSVGKPSDFFAEQPVDPLAALLPALLEAQSATGNEKPISPKPAAPRPLPTAAPTPAERLLDRRGEREKSAEELLGIAQRSPLANGGNGATAAPASPTAPRSGGASETERAAKS